MRDLSRDRSLLAINTATVKAWSLEQAIEGCARAGITAIAPWRDIVQQCGIARAGKLIRAAGLSVTSLCRGGLFPAADAAGRRAALEDNRLAVDEAAAVGAQCLVLIAGGLPPGSKDLAGAHAQVRDGIAALLPYARSAGVPLALEP
ncbi:MAG: TIM barrel protein, partial [Alphaproteobacteria bacterium]